MGNILLLDTETVNRSESFSIYGNNVFDLGFLVVDEKSLEVLVQYNELIAETYRDKNLMKNYVFSQEKLDWYETSRLSVAAIENINKTIQEIVELYNVSSIAAYNINFDIGAIKHTWEKHGLKTFILDGMKIIDIYHMACQALKGNDNYIVACVENGRVSPKGNVNSNAEAVYSFITNNSSFKESHTALEDCIIELEIYKWVLEQEKNLGSSFTEKPNPSCWRLVQKKKA